MAHVAPASAAAIKPSGKGKNASLATALPFSESPASFAFQIAMRDESIRDICRDDHLAETFADHFRQRLGQRTIANDNSSKGRLFISRESLVPGLSRIRIRPDATGIGMFKNCDGRRFKFRNQLRRRADVEN